MRQTAKLAGAAAAVRLPGMAATILTAWILYLFVRKRDEYTAGMAAALFLALGNVFIAGTAADQAPFFTLGLTLFLVSATKFWTEKAWIFVPGMAAGAAILWYAVGFMPLPAFRLAYTPWFLLGLFPLLLLIPVLAAGARRTDCRTPEMQLALAGMAAGLAFFFIGEFTSAMPFLALFAAEAMTRYGQSDPGYRRLNRLLRHWIKVFLAAGILLMACILWVRFGKANPFPMPGNPAVSCFALIVMLVWFFMAMRESGLFVKIAFFSLGAAFFLCGVPAMIPPKVLTVSAPAPLVAKYWNGADRRQKVFATPEIVSLLRYSHTAKGICAVLPAKELAGIFQEEQPHFVILRNKADVPLFPPANRKRVIPPARIIILEYDRP